VPSRRMPMFCKRSMFVMGTKFVCAFGIGMKKVSQEGNFE
jgi:hypothetical protein